VPNEAHGDGGEAEHEQRLHGPDRHVEDQRFAELAARDHEFERDDGQQRAKSRREAVTEHGGQPAKIRSEQTCQRGEREQAIVACGDGAAEHADDEHEVLHHRDGARHAGVEELAQCDFHTRQQGHQRQRENDRKVFGVAEGRAPAGGRRRGGDDWDLDAHALTSPAGCGIRESRRAPDRRCPLARWCRALSDKWLPRR
jgi:hypothetical protein